MWGVRMAASPTADRVRSARRGSKRTKAQAGPKRRGSRRVPPIDVAAHASLRHVSDADPGIRRVRSGRGFAYRDPNGTLIRRSSELARVRSLAIPPAWRDVWICPRADGHIQATGRDARGRKQYRYHSAWQTARGMEKYRRMLAFARALPQLRATVARDLGQRDLPRERVLAAVVSLLEKTLIRVGNDEYARTNNSFGLTTLRDEHADVTGSTVTFSFRGKSGVEHCIDLSDHRLARIVRRCQELPGQQLFQYVTAEGEPRAVGSAEVNDYLRAATGGDFTAKDVRTWFGTVLTARGLAACDPPSSGTAAHREIVRVISDTAAALGNTRAVCRRCYVHPAVLAAYRDGTLRSAFDTADAGEREGWDHAERAVLRLLRRSTNRRAAARPEG